ncbi:MAG: hypothetical protein J6D46_01305 [Lachnospiraceae bacterium]|nr:hypothetical protein [Lachnospiraceae bacterium]
MGMRFDPETGEPIRTDTDYSPNMANPEDDWDCTIAYRRNEKGAYRPGNGSGQTPLRQDSAQNDPYGQTSARSGSYGQTGAQNNPYGQRNAQNTAYGQNNASGYPYGQRNAQNTSYGQGNAQNTSYGQNNASGYPYGQGNAQNTSYGQDNTQSSSYGQNAFYDSDERTVESSRTGNPYVQGNSFDQGDSTMRNSYPASGQNYTSGSGSSGAAPESGNPYRQPGPGTAGPAGKAKKPKKILLPILIACAAICALVGIFFLAKNLLLKPGDQILLAATKTAEGNQLAGLFAESSKALAKSSASSTDLDLSVDFYGTPLSVEGNVSVDYNKKILSVEGSYGSGPENAIKGIFFMDDSMIQAQLPDVSSYKLVYDYTTAPTGFINDFFTQNGLSSSTVNSLLQQIWSTKETANSWQEDLVAITRKNFNALDWEKTEKETFLFNDKDVKAKGYTAVLTASAFNSWVGEYKSSYEKYIESSLPQDYFSSLGLSASDFSSAFDNIQINEDLTINVYLYKSKIVAVRLVSSGGGSLEIDIEGGAYPLENVVVTSDGSEIMALHGTTTGDTETMSVTAYEGQEAASYSYNTKSGALSVTAAGMTIDGTLKKEKDDLILEFNDQAISDYLFDASIRISPEAGAGSAAPSGTEINLNTASSEDLTPFVEDLSNYFF